MDWIQPPAEEEGLSRYVSTLRERMWIVIATVVITVGIAALYLATASKVYEGAADVLIIPAPESDGLLVSLPLIRESSDPTRDVETAARLVTNIDVAKRVKAELNSPASAEDLLSRVTAEPVAQSNIISVGAKGSSPEEAAQLANGFAKETIAEQTQQLHQFIDDALPPLQARLSKVPDTGDTSNTSALGDTSALQATVAELEAKRDSPDPTFQISTEATPPTAPSSPRPLLTIAGALIAGLVLGVAGAFALQVLDPRLRREEQLRRLYRIPILARIPKESHTDAPINPLALSRHTRRRPAQHR